MTQPWIVILLAMVIHGSQALNSYMAMVPSTIRQGTLKVPVLFMSRPASEKVNVTLMDQENRTIVSTSAIADGMKLITPELQIPGTIGRGPYQVEIKGEGSVPFQNRTNVYANNKAMMILIQTDKATYKPGGKVQYRVVALNSTLDIIEPTLDIEFKDPKNNKIAEKNGVKDKYGISGELQLADMPPLGRWTITAEAQGYEDSKVFYNFYVEEYVLPKFEVKVSLPDYATTDMPQLTGSVTAKYTFGKPVNGNLRLTIKKRWSSGFFDARAIIIDLPIQGTASFNIPTKALKRLSRSLEHDTLLVHANVTEAITGITLTGQGDIRYYENPYKVEFFANMPDYFKTSFNPMNVLIRVLGQDNKPPVAPTQKLNVTVTYYTDANVVVPVPNRVDVGDMNVVSPFALGETIILDPVSYTLGADGSVNFDLTIPDSAATATIQAEFAGIKEYKELKRFRSPGSVFLQVNITNGNKLKIGDEADIQLISSHGPITAQYSVIGKGQVIVSGEILANLPVNGMHQGTQRILITRDVGPAARLVVYYMRPDGEIVADGINFVVDDIFENKVAITVDQSAPVTPKTDVNYRVTAANDSLVYVLGVDQSVLLLRDGNDITNERVRSELQGFGDNPWLRSGWGIHSFLPWPIMADDASDIFSDARLTVLTDAHLYDFNIYNVDQPDLGLGGGYGGGNMVMRAAFMDSSPMGGAMSGSAPEGQIRTEFPETMLWSSGQIQNGAYQVSVKAPDTISTFITNAFALSPTKGLGVAQTKSNLTVFLPFFVNMQLPYSVIRGETAIIQANVFNYHPQHLNVKVTLTGTNDFVGVTIDSNGNEVNVTGDMERCVNATTGVPVSVFFSVIPKIVGSMTVNVTISAQYETRNIFDKVSRMLPVKAEGVTKENNTASLVSFQTQGSKLLSIPITYPSQVVPQSQHIQVTAFGDIFGSSLRNLDKLLVIPYGCGEQNMLRFAPAVFAGLYLTETNRTAANADLLQKIRDVLKTGYQRQLVYQRNNGSFSTFGDADDQGSLWLTAFVVKSFAQAHKSNLTYIDPAVMDSAIRYILSYQQRNGSFVNTGLVHNKAMQGGSVMNLRALTAYVLIALKEAQNAEIISDLETLRRLSDAIRTATSLFLRDQASINTDYERAIIAYALKLVGSPNYSTFLQALESSTNRSVVDNEKYWKNPSRALEIEIAAYALLTYANVANQNNGFQILGWLVKQRNGQGGFYSTQDTVLAIQAMAKFASLVYTDNVNLQLDVVLVKNGVSGTKRIILLNRDNHDLLQYLEFKEEAESVSIEAKGTGLALVDVTSIYNVFTDPEPPSYELNVTSSNETSTKHIIKVCAKFNVAQSQSNMAIMDIGSVSGFEPEMDKLAPIPFLKRKEMSSGRLILYFDEIPRIPVCVSVPMQRVTLVAGVKPANVIVYSYYEPNERVMKAYIPSNLQGASLCATCGAECGCPTTASTTGSTQTTTNQLAMNECPV